VIGTEVLHVGKTEKIYIYIHTVIKV